MGRADGATADVPLRPRGRFPWGVGLGGFALGMAVMWVGLKVDLADLGRSGTDTPEALARAVFDALREDDFEAYAVHAFTEPRVQELLDHVRAHGDPAAIDRAERRLERHGGVQGIHIHHLEQSRRRFQRALAEATDAGLDWRTATFEGIPADGRDLREHMGLRGGDLEFVVRSRGRRHRIELDDCVGLGTGWICIDGPIYRGAGRVPSRTDVVPPEVPTPLQADDLDPDAGVVVPRAAPEVAPAPR